MNSYNSRRLFFYEIKTLFFVFNFKSEHGREDMKNYVRTAALDNIFGTGQFNNQIKDFETIVYLELLHEYETHILPMMLHNCRTYLYYLPFTQANTNFGTFNRSVSPIPIPETEEEQKTPLNTTYYRFSAYSMPFPVDNTIQKFRKNPIVTRQRIQHGTVHPESRILLFLIRHDK
jgi:hypothetical protein